MGAKDSCKPSIADTKGHGVMSDKALPALGADADKVGSESVEFWFRLASAAAKMNESSWEGVMESQSYQR